MNFPIRRGVSKKKKSDVNTTKRDIKQSNVEGQSEKPQTWYNIPVRRMDNTRPEPISVVEDDDDGIKRDKFGFPVRKIIEERKNVVEEYDFPTLQQLMQKEIETTNEMNEAHDEVLVEDDLKIETNVFDTEVENHDEDIDDNDSFNLSQMVSDDVDILLEKMNQEDQDFDDSDMDEFDNFSFDIFDDENEVVENQPSISINEDTSQIEMKTDDELSKSEDIDVEEENISTNEDISQIEIETDDELSKSEDIDVEEENISTNETEMSEEYIKSLTPDELSTLKLTADQMSLLLKTKLRFTLQKKQNIHKEKHGKWDRENQWDSKTDTKETIIEKLLSIDSKI